MRNSGRALIWFWSVVLAMLVIGGATLQLLGPPPPRAALRADAPAQPVAREPVGDAAHLLARNRPIAAPDAALLQPHPTSPAGGLPRIADDGRAPMRLYAGWHDPESRLPRVGLLLVGIGLNSADSEDAIRSLPAGVTLGFSPYAANAAPLLQAAREARHEIVLSLPLEPHGVPLNDAGAQALLTGAPEEQNRRRLEWSLGRIAGYAGVTGALGILRGERFAAAPEPMGSLLREIAGRGLYYIDPRPDMVAPAHAWGRVVDIIVDDPPVRGDIDAKLTRLEQLARERGSALGLASAPFPIAVGRIAVWAAGLEDRGIALVPVSALVRRPVGNVAQQ